MCVCDVNDSCRLKLSDEFSSLFLVMVLLEGLTDECQLLINVREPLTAE